MSGFSKVTEGCVEEEELDLGLKQTLNLARGRRALGWQKSQAVLEAE